MQEGADDARHRCSEPSPPASGAGHHGEGGRRARPRSASRASRTVQRQRERASRPKILPGRPRVGGPPRGSSPSVSGRACLPNCRGSVPFLPSRCGPCRTWSWARAGRGRPSRSRSPERGSWGILAAGGVCAGPPPLAGRGAAPHASAAVPLFLGPMGWPTLFVLGCMGVCGFCTSSVSTRRQRSLLVAHETLRAEVTLKMSCGGGWGLEPHFGQFQARIATLIS